MVALVVSGLILDASTASYSVEFFVAISRINHGCSPKGNDWIVIVPQHAT